MENDKANTQVDNTANATNNEENKAGNKTFTQSDLDRIAGKVRAEEQSKNEQAIKEAVATAISEYERNAKLTQEEREKEEKTKRESELQRRENEITLKERKIQAKEMLIENKIPVDLVDFVVDLNETKTKENIDKLIKSFNKSVEQGITDKLKGTPPTDFSTSKQETDKSKKIMSAF